MKTTVALAAAFGLTLASSTGGAMAWAQSGAMTEVKDASGKVLGTAIFTQVADGVRVSGRFQGLPPGPHGIHVHAVGTCEPPFASAGGHFNPHPATSTASGTGGRPRGRPAQLDDRGRRDPARSAPSRGARPQRRPASLFDADGSALVIHANADDDVSDPARQLGRPHRLRRARAGRAAAGRGPRSSRGAISASAGFGTALPALAAWE